MKKEEIMEGICETVMIVSPDAPSGFIVINKDDFDPKTMSIFNKDNPKGKNKKV